MIKKTILVVEDTKFYIDIISEVLEKDYIIYIATDGKAALSVLKKTSPDLILLDILMPGMDGFELCKILKKASNTKEIPIIFLSSLSDEKAEGMGLALGAIDYIKKPFNLELLRARVNNHMKVKSQIGKLEKSLSISNKQLEKEIEVLIESFGALVELRDHDTGKHIHRTKQYMKILASSLRERYPNELTPTKINLLCKSAILHDIGKVGVQDSILLKKSSLTKTEFIEIMRHTILGREVIEKVKVTYGNSLFLNIASVVTEFHHERWDGSGYPYGLKENKIPLYARMMSIIDVYDALTSERPYKKAYTHEEATNIIMNGDDRVQPQHFDPEVLAAFIKANKKFNLVSSKQKVKNDANYNKLETLSPVVI